MSLFQSPSQRQLSIALAALRITVGAIFVAHGAQKLFTFGPAAVAGMFGHMGIPLAGVIGPFVALVEFFGGIALILGLLTRLAAIGIAFDMLGAIAFVHIRGGFFLPSGYEYALTLLAANVALVLSGAGSFSIDGLLTNRAGSAEDAIPHRVAARRAA